MVSHGRPVTMPEKDSQGGESVPSEAADSAMISRPGGASESVGNESVGLDEKTLALIQLAVEIAVADEPQLRQAMIHAASAGLPPKWVEEILLQSYMFCGFPRCLNATREWRRASGIEAPSDDEGTDYRNAQDWSDRGEATCELVYGRFYERLRANVRSLHPALETWMIVDGYGKLLGREALDLRRRELCIVAICAADRQERQLHSHLHGALNAGATAGEVHQALELVWPLLDQEVQERFERLLERVVNH